MRIGPLNITRIECVMGAGCPIDRAAQDAEELARKYNCVVAWEFNGIKCEMPADGTAKKLTNAVYERRNEIERLTEEPCKG